MPGSSNEGTVKKLYASKGFGFIKQNGGGLEDLFFHFSDVVDTVTPHAGDRVSYRVSQKARNKGRVCATRVTITRYSGPPPEKRPPLRGPPQQHHQHHRARSKSPREGGGGGGHYGGKRPLPRSLGRTAVVCSLKKKYGFMRRPDGGRVFFERRHVVVTPLPGRSEPPPPLSVGAVVEYEARREDVVGDTARSVRVLDGVLEPHTYVVYGGRMGDDEDRETEYKSCARTAEPARAVSSICDKYMSAFLNTTGGRIYFGVEDDGLISGLVLGRAERDKVRLAIDAVAHGHLPTLPPEHYRVDFLPVAQELPGGGGGLPVGDLHLVCVTLAAPENYRVYRSRAGVAWYRQDGSVRAMPEDMLRDRERQHRVATGLEPAFSIDDGGFPPLGGDDGDGAGGAGGGAGAGGGGVAADGGPDAFMMSEDTIEGLAAMGFELPQILAALYTLRQHGQPNPSFNVVLDHLNGS